MGVSPASMTRLVDIMVKAKWVLRQRDPNDARAFVLRLSGHGRATLANLRNESTSRLSADIEHHTDDERRTLAAAIPTCAASPTAGSALTPSSLMPRSTRLLDR
jgi:DNA-binding MarR family transcriptional regulator